MGPLFGFALFSHLSLGRQPLFSPILYGPHTQSSLSKSGSCRPLILKVHLKFCGLYHVLCCVAVYLALVNLTLCHKSSLSHHGTHTQHLLRKIGKHIVEERMGWMGKWRLFWVQWQQWWYIVSCDSSSESDVIDSSKVEAASRTPKNTVWCRQFTKPATFRTIAVTIEQCFVIWISPLC